MTNTIQWIDQPSHCLRLLDQTQLPSTVEYLDCNTVEDVWQSIKRLSVRGAPAIGVAAAYGVCLAADCGRQAVLDACDYLATSRPTAVNLFWSLDRMRRVADQCSDGHWSAALLAEARAIHQEDREMCSAIGRHGADWLATLPSQAGILTHCNAGALATAGDGTSLAVIFELHRRGSEPHVWVDETRPLLQGARLTAWELVQRDVNHTLICDSMAAAVMKSGRIQAVITGADRIAANGDAANKIGTYAAAVLASHHDIPFYVAAPSSTFDLSIHSGDEIPIEERSPEEITCGFGQRTAPETCTAFNPAFDVTPATLIRAIITERGVISTPSTATVTAMFGSERA